MPLANTVLLNLIRASLLGQSVVPEPTTFRDANSRCDERVNCAPLSNELTAACIKLFMLKQLQLHFTNVTVAGVEGISLEQLNQKGRIISINEQMK